MLHRGSRASLSDALLTISIASGLAGAALAFGLKSAVILSTCGALILGFLRLSWKSRIGLAVAIAALPIEALARQIPYLASLRELAQPALAIAFLLASLLRVQHAKRSPTRVRIGASALVWATAVLVLLIASAPGSLVFGAQIVECTLVWLAVRRSLLTGNCTPRDLARVLGVSVGVYAGIMLIFTDAISLVQTSGSRRFSPGSAGDNPNRLVGFGGDYELLGQYLAIGLVLQFEAALATRHRAWILWMLIGATLLCLIATASIFAIVMGVVGALIVLTRGRLSQPIRFAWRPAPVALAAVGGVIGWGVAADRLTQRGITTLEVDGSWTASIMHLLNRANVWEAFWQSSDWAKGSLSGRGFPFPYDTFGSYPHNAFLYFWICSGLLGLAMFTLLWAKMLVSSLSQLLQRRDIAQGWAGLVVTLGAIICEPTRLGSFLALLAALLALTLPRRQEFQDHVT